MSYLLDSGIQYGLADMYEDFLIRINKNLHQCVCACVCVCVCERERERECLVTQGAEEESCERLSPRTSIRALTSVYICVCVCV